MMVKVEFYGDTLQAIQDGGKVWVSFRRCCESLGLNFNSQLAKLRKQAWACVAIIATHDVDGRQQDMAMVDLDSLPLWLGGVNAKKVKADLRPKLIRYQMEAARVLAEHFLGKPPPVRVPLRAYAVRCELSHLVQYALPPDHWCVFVESNRLLLWWEEASGAGQWQRSRSSDAYVPLLTGTANPPANPGRRRPRRGRAPYNANAIPTTPAGSVSCRPSSGSSPTPMPR